MAKLSLSEVSQRFNISRSTLYRSIKEGRLSRSSDGLFDIAEVIRCFGDFLGHVTQIYVGKDRSRREGPKH